MHKGSAPRRRAPRRPLPSVQDSPPIDKQPPADRVGGDSKKLLVEGVQDPAGRATGGQDGSPLLLKFRCRHDGVAAGRWCWGPQA